MSGNLAYGVCASLDEWCEGGMREGVMYSLISAVSTTLQMLRTVKFWAPSVTVQERWLHRESCLGGKLIILGIKAAVQRFYSVRGFIHNAIK